MPTRVYLILEPFGLIADDLASCVKEYDGDAIVLTAATPDEAIQRLGHLHPPGVAFMHADPDAIERSPLGEALRTTGTICIYMGDKAERSARSDMLVLQMPFSPQTTAALLSRLAQRATRA